jgi:hypothetical protein
VFAEGVDLPGSLLIGAFIATLGLPPVSAMQDDIQARLDKLFGAGHSYADRVPAMQRVVQAAGRVLRTPEDRGRIGTRSTLITSQLPVKAWHTYLNDPTLADAILDRVVHSSHKIELKATKSMRDTTEGSASGDLAGA